MLTKYAPWRKTIKRKLDPSTLVRFDENKFESNDQRCFTCSDIRIACDACRYLECGMFDLYRDKNYCTESTPLHDLDLRYDYHASFPSETEEVKKEEVKTEFKMKSWYFMENPPMELVYKLRELDKFAADNDINRQRAKYEINYKDEHGNIIDINEVDIDKPSYSSGSCNRIEDDVTQLVNYWNEDSGTITDLSKWKDVDYNYISDKEICLCPSCYVWISFIVPGHQDKFIQVNSAYMAYRQWLEEIEDSLIVTEDN
jgi:hypothetical protein